MYRITISSGTGIISIKLKIITRMKTIALAVFLSAGIAGAYAQTNNNGGTGTPANPSDKTITPNTPNNNGSNKNNTITPNNGGSNKNNTITPNGGTQSNPKDTTTMPNRKSTGTNPSDKKNPSTNPPVGQ
jgi:hypothetical protein